MADGIADGTKDGGKGEEGRRIIINLAPLLETTGQLSVTDIPLSLVVKSPVSPAGNSVFI